MRERRTGCVLLVTAMLGLSLLAAGYLWQHYQGWFVPRRLPLFPAIVPYEAWPTPTVAQDFDFPLLPPGSFSPIVQTGASGAVESDTRYGVQNPAWGAHTNCFRDVDGNGVPFSQLYHAGIDLFGLDNAGRIGGRVAANAPVHAVADGVVILTQDAGTDGTIVIAEHRLADGSNIYSVYWHVAHIQVAPGQPVARGQIIAVVMDRGFNSHLHWEMHTFRDGSKLFPRDSAGARGTCNGRVAAVGYTWDDDPGRAHPDTYGYVDPIAFVEAHQP